MEQMFGEEYVHTSGVIDKSRVLNVKPLRSLVPIFPSAPTSTPQAGAPFICINPSGPFPLGVTPFYPFCSQPYTGQGSQTQGAHNVSSAYPISAAVPINSFRTPSPRKPGVANGGTGHVFVEEDGYSDSQNQNSFTIHMGDGEGSGKVGKRKGRSQKRARGFGDINVVSPDVNTDAMVNEVLSPPNLSAVASLCKAEGDHDSVRCILTIFNLLRKKITQIEDIMGPNSGGSKRPHLKAGTILMTKGIRTNIKKRTGAVPGVEVGEIFYFRFELGLVGLHAPPMAGIDYISLKSADNVDSMAVSIVSSGGYENDVEDGEVLIYSGQGGIKDGAASDQKLERGNLALSQSARRGNEVRVIRGIKDVEHPTGKVYIYDGLYTVQEHWVDKGKSGCSVFKYKLVRCSGQPAAYMTWKSIQQWRDGVVPRTGVILPDLTSGEENVPVSLVNDVDDEKGPAYFTYSPNLKYSRPVTSEEPDVHCNCSGTGGCLPGNLNCHCIQKNGGFLPYIGNGVLVNQKSLLYECGSHCSCPPNCRNRASQGGLKVKLEVFRTKDKGWGMRSWDAIRSGAFVCEFAGEVVDKVRDDDDYIFDATRTWQQQEGVPCDFGEAPKLPFPLIISAKNCGNVARFMNHSCSPNVSWQPVLRSNEQVCDLHITFHANKHIPPLTELTFDYGTVQPDKADQRKKKCLCGSKMCRDYFY